MTEQATTETARPIRPDEVEAQRKRTYPAVIFEAFNELIVEKMISSTVMITVEEAVTRILAKDSTITREMIWRKGWLNIEGPYSEAGWKVKFDRPGYNETYEPNFVFEKPSRE